MSDTWFADALEGSEDKINNALDKGQDVNAIDKEDLNKTALMCASEGGHVNLAKLLVSEGADVKIVNRFNKSALMYASEKGWLEIVQLLIKEGADVNVKHTYGETALIYAAQGRYWEVVECLIENGAVLEASAKAGDADIEIEVPKANNPEEVKASVAALKAKFANMAFDSDKGLPMETPGRAAIAKGGVAAMAGKFS